MEQAQKMQISLYLLKHINLSMLIELVSPVLDFSLGLCFDLKLIYIVLNFWHCDICMF